MKLPKFVGSIITVLGGFPLLYLEFLSRPTLSYVQLYKILAFLVFCMYLLTFLLYNKNKIIIVILFIMSLFPFEYCLVWGLYSDVMINDHPKDEFIMVFNIFPYLFFLILYGLVFDFIKNYLSINKNSEKEGKPTKQSIVLLISGIFLIFLYINMFAFLTHQTNNEKIESFFHNEESSFIILKEEVVKENHSLIYSMGRSIPSDIRTNSVIDSLMHKLYIQSIRLHPEEHNTITIRFRIDLQNEIPPFELWNNNIVLNQYSWSNGESLSLINDYWGIFRYKSDEK